MDESPLLPARRPGAMLISLGAAILCLMASGLIEWRTIGLEAGQRYVLPAFSDAEMTVQVGAYEEDDLPGDAGDGCVGVRVMADRYFPIVRWSRRVSFTDAEGREAHIPSSLRYQPPAGPAEARDRDGQYLAMGLAALLTGVGGWVLWCRRSRGGLLAALVLLRLACMMWRFGYFGFYTTHAGDESKFIAMARLVLTGTPEEAAVYLYPIGMLGAYVPVMAAWPGLGELGVAAIVDGLVFLTCGLTMPLMVVLLLDGCRASLRAQRWAGLSLVLFPWLLLFVNVGAEAAPVLFTAFGKYLSIPGSACMDMFYSGQFLGWSARPDMPALVAGLAGLWLLARWRSYSRWVLLCAGACFGLAIILRLSAAGFLLPAGWLLLCRRPSGVFWRAAAWAAAGAAPFLLAQMLWNAWLFGGPFTFGYHVYPGVYKSFSWAYFPRSGYLLGSMHFQMLAAGGMAFSLVESRHRRVLALGAMLALPVFFYYCGYYFHGSPIRYVLPGHVGLVIATVAAALHLRGAVRILFALGVLATFFLPPHASMGVCTLPTPAWLSPVVWISLATASLVLVRCRRLTVYFVILATGMPLAAMGYCFATGGWLLTVEARRLWRRPPSDRATSPCASSLDP